MFVEGVVAPSVAVLLTAAVPSVEAVAGASEEVVCGVWEDVGGVASTGVEADAGVAVGRGVSSALGGAVASAGGMAELPSSVDALEDESSLDPDFPASEDEFVDAALLAALLSDGRNAK